VKTIQPFDLMASSNRWIVSATELLLATVIRPGSAAKPILGTHPKITIQAQTSACLIIGASTRAGTFQTQYAARLSAAYKKRRNGASGSLSSPPMVKQRLCLRDDDYACDAAKHHADH
jgi:hypothetical protein